jgi:hypothetical protein
MGAELLWMEEDELRATCLTLSALLQFSEMNTVRAVNEALQYGYRQGYTDAAVRITYAIKEGDAASLVLH